MTQDEALKDFFLWAMRKAWNGYGLDDSDVQDKAEALGLIIKEPYDPKKHGEHDCDIEPGDDWYVFAPGIK